MIGFSFTSTWAIVLYVLGVLVLVGTFVQQQHAAFRWLGRRWRRSSTAEEPPLATAVAPAVDPRVLTVTPAGGGSGYVDFFVEIANYGTRQGRSMVTARVGTVDVQCVPDTIDLIPARPAERVRVLVPRPELGDLVPEFNNDTTLHDETLFVEAAIEGEVGRGEWHEHVYRPEENNERYTIQQRKWRLARGEETEADRRHEYLADLSRRAAERFERPDRYIDL